MNPDNDASESGNAATRALLWCGILSTLWYVAINIVVPPQYEGYRLASFTVSELSAIGAPTRRLWITLVAIYPFLFAAFGVGVLRSAGTNKALRTIGWMVLGYSFFNIYWPPMHQRGVEPTLTDALHIAWASVTIILMVVMMVAGAAAFGPKFRAYTISSIVGHFVFGLLTGLEAPNIVDNGPTAWIGVWERINIGIFMLWVAVLSIRLLQINKSKTIQSL